MLVLGLILAMLLCSIAYAATTAVAPKPTPTPTIFHQPTVEPTIIILHNTPTPTATPWTVPPIKVHPTPAPIIDGLG